MQYPPKAVLLDMDGVLYHGSTVLPYAVDFLIALKAVPKLFITNNPIATQADIAERLQKMGFPPPAEDDILTSAIATAKYLHQRKPGFRYFSIGAAGLDLALSRYGTADKVKADFVVVGEGEGLDYQSLTRGINLILKQGSELIATNPDQTVDATVNGEHKILPGGGALLAPFEVACGHKAIVIGKPKPLLFEMALEKLGVNADDCIMIGDRADTDIAGAQRMGIRTAMVRTGRLAPSDPWPEDIPAADWDMPSLHDLFTEWSKQWPGWLGE